MKLKRPKAPTVFLIAGTIYILFCTRAIPTEANKAAGGLRLSTPVESPDGVHFSWTGGAEDATYSIYRKNHEPGWEWERIALGLSGSSGAVNVPGFTLDKTYDYKIQADEP